MKKHTLESIKELIEKTEYYHYGNKVCICFITLKNSFVVTGKSGVINQNDFDATIGEKFAYQDAINQIWALEGYKAQEEILFNTYEGKYVYANDTDSYWIVYLKECGEIN